MIYFSKFLLIKRVKKNLLFGFSKRAGKNCFGRKTIFTQSGGYRLFFNSIDLKRNIIDFYMLLAIEKSILYTSLLGLICYLNGYFCYIFLSDFFKKISSIYYGFTYKFSRGSTFLDNIPAGNFIHHVEVQPGLGVKIMRAAGTAAFIFSKEGNYSVLKMKSG